MKLRKGMWVRLVGWQIHWPQENAKIKSIGVDGYASLDRPILGQLMWKLSDLTKSF